jgi:hypothetical protein
MQGDCTGMNGLMGFVETLRASEEKKNLPWCGRVILRLSKNEAI